MITTRISDITKLNDVDYICNAANAIGPMGAGVAGAIRRSGGKVIEQEAFEQCKLGFNPGDIYVTSAGTLPYKKIWHLVTMKRPGGKTSYDIVRQCLRTLTAVCNMRNVKKVALPALGTGIGGLDIDKVAEIYVELLQPISYIEFLIVDIDKNFINSINNKLNGVI